jgi:hypothetical protein
MLATRKKKESLELKRKKLKAFLDMKRESMLKM